MKIKLSIAKLMSTPTLRWTYVCFFAFAVRSDRVRGWTRGRSEKILRVSSKGFEWTFRAEDQKKFSREKTTTRERWTHITLSNGLCCLGPFCFPSPTSRRVRRRKRRLKCKRGMRAVNGLKPMQPLCTHLMRRNYSPPYRIRTYV